MNYITVAGEEYTREIDAIQSAIRIANREVGGNFGVRYDGTYGVYRVVRLLD